MTNSVGISVQHELTTAHLEKFPMHKLTLPETGYLRVSQIIQLIPVGKSSWWKGVRSGRYPQPVKLGPKTTAWRVEDIRALIEQLEAQA